MSADIKIEPSASGNGWYWAVVVDGEIYADGECDGHAEARDRAHANYQEWNLKQ